MNEPELTKWKNQYREDAYYYRGKLIDTFNSIEKNIEDYLVIHFEVVPHKRYDFQMIVLDRLNFQSKKECFATVVNNKALKNGFIKTNNNSYPHSNLFKDIQEAQDERNCFAHYYLVVPLEHNETIITLAEFRDSLKFHEYSMDEYQNLIYKMSDCIIAINKLKTTIT